MSGEEDKTRVSYSATQRKKLEEVFAQQDVIDSNVAQKLANQLSVSVRQIRTWFQNKRAKRRRDEFKKSGRAYPIMKSVSSAANSRSQAVVGNIVPQWTYPPPSLTVTPDVPSKNQALIDLENMSVTALGRSFMEIREDPDTSLSLSDLSEGQQWSSGSSFFSWNSEGSNLDLSPADGATSLGYNESTEFNRVTSSMPVLSNVQQIDHSLVASAPNICSTLEFDLPGLSLTDIFDEELNFDSCKLPADRQSSTNSLTSMIADLEADQKTCNVTEIIDFLKN